MLHFVTSYMKQNKSHKQTLENAQYGLEMLVLGLSKYVKIVQNGGGGGHQLSFGENMPKRTP